LDGFALLLVSIFEFGDNGTKLEGKLVRCFLGGENVSAHGIVDFFEVIATGKSGDAKVEAVN